MTGTAGASISKTRTAYSRAADCAAVGGSPSSRTRMGGSHQIEPVRPVLCENVITLIARYQQWVTLQKDSGRVIRRQPRRQPPKGLRKSEVNGVRTGTKSCFGRPSGLRP
jgi:hypothetical protein